MICVPFLNAISYAPPKSGFAILHKLISMPAQTAIS